MPVIVRLVLLASLAGALACGPAAAAEIAAPDRIVFHISIFVLAVFVGYFVVWAVTPALHTPLMSVTNAISAIVIIGAIIAAVSRNADAELNAHLRPARLLGAGAVFLAAINIFGGFLVTRRMIAMYRKTPKS